MYLLLLKCNYSIIYWIYYDFNKQKGHENIVTFLYDIYYYFQ